MFYFQLYINQHSTLLTVFTFQVLMQPGLLLPMVTGRQWAEPRGNWSSQRCTRSQASSPATWASSPGTASPSPPRPTPSTTGGRGNWRTAGWASSPPTLSPTDPCWCHDGRRWSDHEATPPVELLVNELMKLFQGSDVFVFFFCWFLKWQIDL